jgi:hypothetical protein
LAGPRMSRKQALFSRLCVNFPLAKNRERSGLVHRLAAV